MLESPFVLRLLAVSTFFCVGVSKGLTLVSPLLLGAAAAAAARAAALFAAVPGHQHGQLQPGDGGGGGLGEQQGEQGVGGGRGGGHGGEGGVLEANDDALAEARIAAQFVVGFACAAFGSKLFKEAQMLAYQKVGRRRTGMRGLGERKDVTSPVCLVAVVGQSQGFFGSFELEKYGHRCLQRYSGEGRGRQVEGRSKRHLLPVSHTHSHGPRRKQFFGVYQGDQSDGLPTYPPTSACYPFF